MELCEYGVYITEESNLSAITVMSTTIPIISEEGSVYQMHVLRLHGDLPV